MKMNKEKNIFFIKHNVASSKNGKMWTGSRFIASKSTREWRENSRQCWEDNKDKFKEQLVGLKKPYIVGYHFVRNSKRRYDWANPVNSMQDEMVKYSYLDDDNVTEMFPIPLSIDGEFTSYDRNNAGVYMKIFTDPEEIKKLHEILNIKPNV